MEKKSLLWWTIMGTLIVILSILVLVAIVVYPRMSRPVDLYDPLILKPINLSAIGAKYSVEYQNKYEGKHVISIAVDNPPPVGQAYETDSLDLAVEMISNEQLLLKENVKRGLYPFWDMSGQNSGIAIIRYKVPDDAPLGKVITINLSITGNNSAFTDKYKNTKLLIKKISDE